jgi:alpha-N-arabinofuranosidase
LFDITTSHCLSICIPFLKNAFRWKDTVGPWEERPGHFGDVWQYWTDDGLGYYELLQVFLD